LSDRLSAEEKHTVDAILTASDKPTALLRRTMDSGRRHVPGQLEENDRGDAVRDTVEFARAHRRRRRLISKNNCRAGMGRTPFEL